MTSTTGSDNKDKRSSLKTATNAYDAFTMVDNAVSKPVYGSDAAATWQEFKKNSASAIVTRNVAPQMPMKRSDKLGAGFKTMKEEREHEERVRNSHGHAELGSGYTVFKKKGHESGNETSKETGGKRKLYEQYSDPMKCGKLASEFRERPDDMIYFIASETFAGWKKDYVFSTRHRGTGYYWDGMDSVKERHGLTIYGDGKGQAVEDEIISDTVKTKKKKKKKKESLEQIPDSIDPFQQVADAIARRNAAYAEKMGLKPQDSDKDDLKALVAAGWSVAHDSASGKRYYFHNDTRRTVWENPIATKTKDLNDMDNQLAAAGWSCAVDSASGKKYYYHNQTRETRWENPLLENK